MSNQKEQTKGTFRIRGIVTGLGNKNVFKEDTTKSGLDYRTIKFSVKTSPVNKIDVEIFAIKPEFVYPYSSKDKKSLKIPFADREVFKEDGYFEKNKKLFADKKKFPKSKQLYNPDKDHIDSYHVVGISLTDNNGKVALEKYDGTAKILEMFNDGDTVFITGELQPNTYVNKQGVEVFSARYNIGSIRKDVDVKFEDKDFQEISSFEQEVIINETFRDEDKQRTVLNAYTIGYGDKIEKIQLAVHDERTPKMAKKFEKLKFGDYLKLQGLARNEAEQIIVDEVEEEDEWGSETPSGYNNSASTRYNPELVVTAVAKKDDGTSAYVKQKYTREDFIEDSVEEDDDISLDDLDEETPVGLNDDNSEEDEDDDVPF
ncbi:hypothetical protein [Clostridium sp.]|jgi:hypothetical protein|uniref:hypothetical protein n=1 Tax=Clostridium sp. TaxID=1506 RepID=UPI00258E419C|nr:hypothetical protein [Clostridium sp.]MDF2503881.1 hypothetical protein [Clostridium sp.]